MNAVPFQSIHPIQIVPWDVPFLPVVQRIIVTTTQGQPGRAVVIMPHKRPKRYLTECFQQDTGLPRPFLLPRMLSADEFVSLWRAHAAPPAHRNAAVLDQIALLHRAVREVAHTSDATDIHARFADMDIAHFAPWGLRLATLLEECFTQGVDAQDMSYTDASPVSAALLSALGRIQARYTAILREGDWTTPGLDALIAAKSATAGTSIPSSLRPGPDRHVFILGFGSLTHTENMLLHRLWQAGAHIFLHSDPALTDAKATPHFACTDHARCLREWRAASTLACPPLGRVPDIRFFSAYDVHSQLVKVEEALADDTLPTTALVLANTSLLMPILHSMPDLPYNVSMGYPLDRAPVCTLLETILRMHESALSNNPDRPDNLGASDNPGALGQPLYFHWRALRHCLHHPCLTMLMPADNTPLLRDTLYTMEKVLRDGPRFANPHALAQTVATDLNSATRDLLKSVLTIIVDTVAVANTLYAMGDAIRHLCELLLTYGTQALEHSPLNAESLYRILRHVVPQLTGNALAHEALPQGVLFGIVRELLRAERVPFEADPLTGVQILGMLETRLLHFDRLIVVDITDDALPGFTAQDPLLPDALRAALGLPNAHSRERTAAYTLYRLLAGAGRVHLLWQEGVQASTLFDNKKLRSRFVDDCLWRIEQERGAVLTPGTPPLHVASCPIVPPQPIRTGPPVSEALRMALHQRCAKGLSATLLDAYLRCPACFAWEHLLRLAPEKDVNEGDDPLAVGTLLHDVLHQAYTPWLGKTLHKGGIEIRSLQTAFSAALAASSQCANLPPDSRLMLEVAAPRRLALYLENQPDTTHIHALEKQMSAPLPDSPWRLYGRLDRADRRDGGLYILDYKTGRTQIPGLNIWEDATLWNGLSMDAARAADADVLYALAEVMPSVQLPAYIYLCGQGGDTAPLAAADTVGSFASSMAPYDAAFVDLRDTGKEQYLLGPDADDALRTLVIHERIPHLLTFLAVHIAHATAFVPRESKYCAWCAYANICLTD